VGSAKTTFPEADPSLCSGQGFREGERLALSAPMLAATKGKRLVVILSHQLFTWTDGKRSDAYSPLGHAGDGACSEQFLVLDNDLIQVAVHSLGTHVA